MQFDGPQLTLSATDLAKHLACRHLTSLDLRVARGEIERPFRPDPGKDALAERGFRHEAAYLAHLRANGLRVDASSDTLTAMRAGADVIPQADLREGNWHGRADVLLRVSTPSALGDWSYEVVDTKLARETRGGTILQLCLYTDLVCTLQGRMPEHMHVIAPGRDFRPETFRSHDFLAYYRYVRSRLANITGAATLTETYPEPVPQCEICHWWRVCDARRRQDDHLSFVAGISRLQIGELQKWKIATLADLGVLPVPLKRKPERGNSESYIKVREQARLQLERRTSGTPLHELLPLEPERGLARLPEPSPGDIFLDFEADPFVEEGGIEYLLGYVILVAESVPNREDSPSSDEEGEGDGVDQETYTAIWSFDRTHERRCFESFIDMVTERRKRFPNLHVYHFSPYETAALKRLMGRYATREDEMDHLLRAGVFVDLHSVVRQALRASVERYSLKDLEVFFAFERKTDLRDARHSLTTLEYALELNELDGVPAEVLQTVEGYNREDCVSALRLRDWLERLRRAVVAGGHAIARPVMDPGEASEEVEARRQRALAQRKRLLAGIPDDPAERTREVQAQWLLAHMLEWHRREKKVAWWEYFRLKELGDDELMEERAALAGLRVAKRMDGGTKVCPIDRYYFAAQETQLREGDDLETSVGKFGSVAAIDLKALTVDIKKRGDTADVHPTSVFTYKNIREKELADSLDRIGSWVADHGMDAPGPYRAGRDLLLRRPPRLKAGAPRQLLDPRKELVSETRRLALQLDRGILPIQGPPGAGKTYTGARMICALLGEGKKVGITAVSHKVIRKLLEEVLDAARTEAIKVHCVEKVTEKSDDPNPGIPETTDNKRVLAALQAGEVTLVAGTAWLWAREEFEESVDVLFVDEAGQMSLTDVLAVSPAARSLVLLGDPAQLDQPLQGTHPPGLEVSALQHILGTHETMPPEQGLFLAETWRLAPPICAFTSELFYEYRLESRAGLELQKVTWPDPLGSAGLWFVPVEHRSNQNSSDEEAEVVVRIVGQLHQPGVFWTNMQGKQVPLKLTDILVVSPYNAQVFNLAGRLPSETRVGTVDKFQGQEAPVVIYSMATSSPADAPRGMEFLYSLNRFNVATSRARCAVFVVASPKLLEPECQTPRQMKLANALCRYREMATELWSP